MTSTAVPPPLQTKFKDPLEASVKIVLDGVFGAMWSEPRCQEAERLLRALRADDRAGLLLGRRPFLVVIFIPGVIDQVSDFGFGRVLAWVGLDGRAFRPPWLGAMSLEAAAPDATPSVALTLSWSRPSLCLSCGVTEHR